MCLYVRVGGNDARDKPSQKMKNQDPITLNVTAAGWSSVYASYEPASDTVFVQATANNGDRITERWTRDGIGSIGDCEVAGDDGPFSAWDKLTDALFTAVWAAAVDTAKERNGGEL